jgi:nitroreductase
MGRVDRGGFGRQPMASLCQDDHRSTLFYHFACVVMEREMDIFEAIHGRRSIRDYLPRVVDASIIEAVIEDAAQAPWTPISAPEPWAFTVIRGLKNIGLFGARALQYARENRPEKGYGWTERPDFSVFFNAPTVIIISGKSGNPLALEECTRAGQILTLSAFARGLGTCWVGSPMLWLGDQDVRAELCIPDGFEPQAVFTLGYPVAAPKNPGLVATRTNWLGVDEA